MSQKTKTARRTSVPSKKSRPPYQTDPAEWDTRQIWGRPSDPDDHSCAPGKPRYRTFVGLLDTEGKLETELWLQDSCEFDQASRNWAVATGRDILNARKRTSEHVASICEMHGLSEKVDNEAYDLLVPKDANGKQIYPGNSSQMEKLWTKASQEPRYKRWSHCIKYASNEAIKSQCESFKRLQAGTGGMPRFRKLADSRSFIAVRTSEISTARERSEETETATKGFKLSPGRKPNGKCVKRRTLNLPKMGQLGLSPLKFAVAIPARISYDNIRQIKIVRTWNGRWEAHITWIDGVYPERRKPGKGTGIDVGARKLAVAENATTGEKREFLPAAGEKYYFKQRRRLQRKIEAHKAEQLKQFAAGNYRLPSSTKLDEHGNPYYDRNGNPILGKSRKILRLEMAMRKLDAKQAERRKNAQRLLARRIVDNADMLIIEDLSPANMKAKKTGQGKRGRKANRVIAAGAMGRTRDMLVEQAHAAGIAVMMLDAAVPSSKTCSRCHMVNRQARGYNSRDFTCEICRYTEDSDFNAARNIAAAGKRAGTQLARSAPDTSPGLADWRASDSTKRRRKPLECRRGKTAHATVPKRTETTWGCLADTAGNDYSERSGDPPSKPTGLQAITDAVSRPLANHSVPSGIAKAAKMVNTSSI